METYFKDCRALFGGPSATLDEYPPLMKGEYGHSLMEDGTGLGNNSFAEQRDGRRYTDLTLTSHMFNLLGMIFVER